MIDFGKVEPCGCIHFFDIFSADFRASMKSDDFQTNNEGEN